MGGRKCSICFHAETAAISKAIGQGEAFRPLAVRFHTTNAALCRHASNCLGITRKHKKTRAESAVTASGDSLRFESMTPAELIAETRHLLEDAKQKGDNKTRLAAITLLMRVEKMLEHENGSVNIDARRQTIELSNWSDGDLRTAIGMLQNAPDKRVLSLPQEAS